MDFKFNKEDILSMLDKYKFHIGSSVLTIVMVVALLYNPSEDEGVEAKVSYRQYVNQQVQKQKDKEIIQTTKTKVDVIIDELNKEELKEQRALSESIISSRLELDKKERDIIEKQNEEYLNQMIAGIEYNDNEQIYIATNDTVTMLAKIIHAEAGNQPYEGKVAVGAVIVNRVASGRFAKTIEGVIMGTNQFEPTANGAYARAVPTAEDYRAAKDALNGSDPTNGATYFYNPEGTKSRWHETLKFVKWIGDHKFFK